MLPYIFLVIFLNCASGNQAPRRNPNVTGLTKAFPDGTSYFLVYSIPPFFPDDLPVYTNAKTDKMYVYGERDMDIIMFTSDNIDKIVEFYVKRGSTLGWQFEGNLAKSSSSFKKIEIPLTFNKHSVEKLSFNTEFSRFMSASKANITIECLIMKISNAPLFYIIQEIRTLK